MLAIPNRQSLRAVFYQSVAGTLDVQLTGIADQFAGASAQRLPEFALTVAQTMNAVGSTISFDLSTPPNVQWLLVKLTNAVGAPTVHWNIMAYD